MERQVQWYPNISCDLMTGVYLPIIFEIKLQCGHVYTFRTHGLVPSSIRCSECDWLETDIKYNKFKEIK